MLPPYSPFKYFLPGRLVEHVLCGGLLVRGELVAAGIDRTLADVLGDRDCGVHQVHANGPGGHSGVMIIPRGIDGMVPPCTYQAAKQGWLEAAGGACWIGWERDSEPRPEALRRQTVVSGHTVRDASGFVWQVPVARTPTLPYGLLPQTYRFGADGEPVGQLKNEFTELWERAGQLWELYAWHFTQQKKAAEPETALAEREPPPAEWHSNTWLLQQAVWILGVNYRVGPLEINAFAEMGHELLDDDFKQAVCQAVCDFDFLSEAGKKATASTSSARASGGSNSTPGGEGDSRSTGPASPGSG